MNNLRINRLTTLFLSLALVSAPFVPATAVANEHALAKRFMVSAANPLAAEVGYEVLKVGGTAADAAVAVQMMLNLVEPQSSGIGGGAFMLYWDNQNKKLHTFDGRETAPLLATPEYFLKEDGTAKGWWESVIGGRSVGVPGTLRLLETVHQRFGNRAWASLLFPTIDLAQEGFVISPRLASSIAAHNTETRQLAKFANTQRYFFNADGSPKVAGTRLKNPEFADTLRSIAAGGADAFYQGEIAADIVAAVRADLDNPGILQQRDFSDYQVIERAPVCIDYRRYNVCGMGPPTSGGLTVGQILGMLSHYDLPKLGNSVESAHLFAEAARLAYADRGLYMADSDFVTVPAGLLDKRYLAQRAEQINPQRAAGKVEAGLPPPLVAQAFAAGETLNRPGTSHFVIVDQYGNIVSMTTTIETGFGSRLMVRGFLLNNELTDFSRTPKKDNFWVANRVESGKRPRSSMSPTIVFRNQRPVLAVGSPGGSRIINYVARAIIGVLDWKMTPQEAIDMGHVVNRNGDTDVEKGTTAAAWAQQLTALGHKVNENTLTSGLHAIELSRKGLQGGADKRREGVVLGD